MSWKRGPTYQTNNQTIPNVTKALLAITHVLTEPVDEVGHGSETGDLTSRVTEDETTHGDDNTQDKGPPSQVLDGAIVDDAIVLLNSRV